MKNKYTVQRPNMDVINVMRLMLAMETLATTRKDIRILELGCNEGINLHALHKIYPDAEYVGIDYCDEALEAGQEKYPEITFFRQNLDRDKKISNAYLVPIKPFDYILMPDILEHLSDPLQCLRWVKKMLKPGGVTVSCIPNLMHVSIMDNLLRHGEFTYADVGLLDSDHKHLFTKNSIRRMFLDAGFRIEDMLRSKIRISEIQHDFIHELSLLSASHVPVEDFETFEYIVVTEPKEKE